MGEQSDLFARPGPGRHGVRVNARDLLALASVRGVGQASIARLHRVLPDLASIWQQPETEVLRWLEKVGTPSPARVAKAIVTSKAEAEDAADRMLEVLDKRGIVFVRRGDPEYPSSLEDLDAPPSWLFVEGDPALLARRSSAAVVGTRKPTENGVAVAGKVATLLSERGWVVVSGLAEGIDAAAHEAVVHRGGGAVAVLGTGILLDFPATTVHLRRQIAERGGAVISEYLPETRYSRQTFVQRNRIQAALSSVVMPIEGAENSGTAHTVRFAEALGRLLVAVFDSSAADPGHNPMVQMLERAGHPAFDLGRAGAVAELLSRLEGFETDVGSKADRLDRGYQAVYGPALRALGKALRESPPEEEARAWLRDRVDRLIERAREAREEEP